MTTVIYTFEDKKPVFFKKARFYKVESEAQYSSLIESFLEIDAVTTPNSPEEVNKYPIYLELKAGFSPVFRKVSKKYIKKQIKKAKKLI